MPAGTDGAVSEGTQDRADATLPDTERRLHRVLLEALIATGTVPTEDELAGALGIGRDVVRRSLQALARADYLAVDAAGRPACLYPFSAVPTPHVVVIEGKRRYAMCALDALGVAAMLGRPVEIESSCATCGTPVRVAVDPGAIAAAQPGETTVVAKRPSDAPAAEACCAFTVFACGPAHAADLLARIPDASALDLATALAQGSALFASLLGEALPAKRSRSRSATPGIHP